MPTLDLYPGSQQCDKSTDVLNAGRSPCCGKPLVTKQVSNLRPWYHGRVDGAALGEEHHAEEFLEMADQLHCCKLLRALRQRAERLVVDWDLRGGANARL